MALHARQLLAKASQTPAGTPVPDVIRDPVSHCDQVAAPAIASETASSTALSVAALSPGGSLSLVTSQPPREKGAVAEATRQSSCHGAVASCAAADTVKVAGPVSASELPASATIDDAVMSPSDPSSLADPQPPRDGETADELLRHDSATPPDASAAATRGFVLARTPKPDRADAPPITGPKDLFSNSICVVVGVNKYEHARLSDLRYAVHDSVELQSELLGICNNHLLSYLSISLTNRSANVLPPLSPPLLSLARLPLWNLLLTTAASAVSVPTAPFAPSPLPLRIPRGTAGEARFRPVSTRGSVPATQPDR